MKGYMKGYEKFILSSRNRKVYKDYEMYYFYTLNQDTFGHKMFYLKERKRNFYFLNGSESRLKESLSKSHLIFQFYAALSMLLMRLQSFYLSKLDGEVRKINTSFTDDYLNIRDIYSMSLASCLRQMKVIYSSHKFDSSFVILERLNQSFPDYFDANPFAASDEVTDNVSKNIYGLECNRFSSKIDDLVLTELLFSDKTLKKCSQQKVYRRNKQLMNTIRSDYTKITEQIISSEKIISEQNDLATIMGFSLYYNHPNLPKSRYEINILINKFFSNLTKKIKKNNKEGIAEKVFYTRNVAFDNLVGVNLNLLVTSNVEFLETWIKQEWLSCCTSINHQADVGCETTFLSGSRLYKFSYQMYVLFGCIKKAFVKLDLPGIRSFSMGRLHEKQE